MIWVSIIFRLCVQKSSELDLSYFQRPSVPRHSTFEWLLSGISGECRSLEVPDLSDYFGEMTGGPSTIRCCGFVWFYFVRPVCFVWFY